jgi:ABC-type transport system involved in Fe-S cluster assembly fused permease/ATPase subunit
VSTRAAQDADGAKDLCLAGGSVEFRGVDFAYDAERVILRDFSLTIPAGKTVAVVGSSGCGSVSQAALLGSCCSTRDELVPIC